MRSTFLSDDVISLVTLVKEDAPTLMHAMNNLEITRFLSRGHTPIGLAEEEEWVEGLRNEKEHLVLGVWHNGDKTLIGTIGLHRIDYRNQHATLGIALYDTERLGKGFGTRAITLLVEHAFLRMNLRMVDLDVLHDNARAIACYEKCGFKEVGRVPEFYFKEGVWYDEVIMVKQRG